jgi:hypothetical protein
MRFSEKTPGAECNKREFRHRPSNHGQFHTCFDAVSSQPAPKFALAIVFSQQIHHRDAASGTKTAIDGKHGERQT